MGQLSPRLSSLEARYGVSYLLYYIRLESNSKHNEDYYLQSLREECNALTQEGRRFSILGDRHIFESVPECAQTSNDTLQRQHVWQRSFAELPYADVAMSMGVRCSLKFGTPVPPGQFRNLSRIWLSKLPMLCEVAETQPDQVTVLLDSGMFNNIKRGDKLALQRWKYALGALSEEDFETEAIHMSHVPDMIARWNYTWFGRRKCSHVNPQVNAMFIAIRGRHCPKVMKAYSEALLRVRNTTCHCFDEEVVLTDMLSHAGLIQTVPAKDGPRVGARGHHKDNVTRTTRHHHHRHHRHHKDSSRARLWPQNGDAFSEYYENALPTVMSDMLRDRAH